MCSHTADTRSATSPDYTESLASLQEMISATGLPAMTVDLQGPAIDLILDTGGDFTRGFNRTRVT